MLRLSLRLMRRSARHIAAGGLAVAVATAFMAAALTGAAVMNTTVRDMVAQQFGEASLVVSRGPVEQLNSPPLGSDAIALEVDGVADAFLPISLTALVSADNQRSEWVSVRSWPANSRLAGWPAAQGREGAGAGEATVAWSLAQRLELAPGSRVRLSVELGQPKPDDAAEPVSATTELQVTGVFDDRGPTAYERPAVQTPPETFAQLADPAALAATATVGSLLVVAEPGVATGPGDPLRAALTEALAAAWGDLLGGEACPGGVRAAVRPEQAVLSGDPWCEVVAQDTREAARALTANYLGSADTVLAAGLIFALVSLAVAGLVIANTFQVMVASRTRVLGLLRSLGATRAQLRALVLVEALATGLAASGVGVAGGWALIEGSLLVAGRAYPGIPLPAAAPLPPAVVALCLVAGGAATTAAALAPAALATRVAPVEALHPLAPPSMEIGAGGLRFWWSVMADLGGAALIAAGLLVANSTAEGQAYPVGQLAGAALGAAGSAAVGVGLLVGAVFWVPKVMAAAARPLARAGAAARLAAAN
ncbi:MAG: ABC transporter permease, partial [Bifidobacteriaceae bacterium]|nr:ABC transporter permease [Bifidobacteriaceae bacterium]